jgi:hypothetical protein
VECVGAVKHHVELIDVERRRSASVRCEHLLRSFAELLAGIPSSAGGACIMLGVGVKLVDQRLFGVDELVYDFHEPDSWIF